MVAVVGALDLEDHVAAGDAARKMDRVHRRLGAGVREPPLRQAEAARNSSATAIEPSVGAAKWVPRSARSADRLCDHRVRVPDAHHAEAVVEVDVLVAVDVPYLRPQAALDVNGPRIVLLERRRHALRHHPLRALEVLARAGRPLREQRADAARARLGRDRAAAFAGGGRSRRCDRSGGWPPSPGLGGVLLPLRARHAAVRAARVRRPSRRQRRLRDGRARADPRRLSLRILGAGRAPRAARSLAAGFFTTRPSSSTRADRQASVRSHASAPPWAPVTVNQRGSGFSPTRNALGVIGAPLVPFLMTYRVIRQVAAKRRHGRCRAGGAPADLLLQRRVGGRRGTGAPRGTHAA